MSGQLALPHSRFMDTVPGQLWEDPSVLVMDQAWSNKVHLQHCLVSFPSTGVCPDPLAMNLHLRLP